MLKEYQKALFYFDKSIENEYKPNLGDSVSLAFLYSKLVMEKESLEVIKACTKSINNIMITNPDIPGYIACLNTNLCSISLMLNEKEVAVQYLIKAAQLDINSIYNKD